MNQFRNDIINWLTKNGISNIDIDFRENFCYDVDNHIIYCGTCTNEEGEKFFQQYLYEYGSDWGALLWGPMLCFLHELGHACTLPNFTPGELKVCHFLKGIIDEEEPYNWYFKYWDTPDEFAANMWVINFLDTYVDAVCDLYSIMVSGYKHIYEKVS
jgi:hypothetical protein